MDDTASTTSESPAASNRTDGRGGVALCLSGGGFRAALFHLGALRRLNELGVLSRIDTISAVSGGSLVAAHLAESISDWPSAGEVIPDWDAEVAAPFRGFVKRNLRTGPLLSRALPWNWTRSDTAIEALARELHHRLTGMTLGRLPERPRYIFSATEMTFGVNWIFERTRTGDYQAGYIEPDDAWTVARAAAASSCFPPVFEPMHLRLAPGSLKKGAYRGADRDDLVADLQLTDGGVYDNMALEPVWKDHGSLLVSDGGAVFDYNSESNAIQRLLRYPALLGKQAASIRRRWLIAGLATDRIGGAYWDIGNTSEPDGSGISYSAGLVSDVISQIRTDLDAFSLPEIAVLENHGYLAADRVLAKRASHLITRTVALSPPFPEWLGDETRIREALRGSDRRTFLGRWQVHSDQARSNRDTVFVTSETNDDVPAGKG